MCVCVWIFVIGVCLNEHTFFGRITPILEYHIFFYLVSGHKASFDTENPECGRKIRWTKRYIKRYQEWGIITCQCFGLDYCINTMMGHSLDKSLLHTSPLLCYFSSLYLYCCSGLAEIYELFFLSIVCPKKLHTHHPSFTLRYGFKHFS